MRIFRIDDVSVNTDVKALIEMSKFLNEKYPDAVIWWCVNIFCKEAKGSVYPDLPLKEQPNDYFAEVDRMLPILSVPQDYIKFVSHGMFHMDHSSLGYDTQLFSIVPSCRVLKSNIFVPPFNRFNESTELICKRYGINLVRSYDEGWKSLESDYFDPIQNKWFFHAWRFESMDKFKERFSAC